MEDKTKNKYAYPIEGGDNVKISYSKSPAHIGNLKYAVDFICREGTPVKAAFGGVVVDLKMDSNVGGQDKKFEFLGNFIEIKHENEEYSEYEHLRKDGVLLKVGDKIEQGQIIGFTGATGYLAHLGPHLHFMVGRYGATISDYKTLKIVWQTRWYT